MKNIKISHCLALASLVDKHLISKEAEIQEETGYSNEVAIYLVVDQTRICVNEWIGFHESRTNSASIVVIDDNGKVYSFQIPHHLHFDIYYAFRHIEGVMCDDEKAEIIIGRGNYDDNNLLFNQSNKLFKLAFGNLDSDDETGRIICERR